MACQYSGIHSRQMLLYFQEHYFFDRFQFSRRVAPAARLWPPSHTPAMRDIHLLFGTKANLDHTGLNLAEQEGDFHILNASSHIDGASKWRSTAPNLVKSS